MRVEQIAIIYPDESQIPEIKNWLKPYSSLTRTAAFSSLGQAVPILNKFPCDMMIAADRFPEAHGAILLKGLCKLCPDAQFILLATESTPVAELAAIARSDLNVHYFPLPWDKESLLAHIEAGIGKEAPSVTTAIVFDEDQLQRISTELESLLKETSALSVYLVTALGQILDYKGTELSQISEISSLLGGSFAALQQLSNTLGEQGPAANLIHRQGPREDLYALSVGNVALLVLRFAVSPTSPRIGTVSFYARQTAAQLSGILGESPSKSTHSFESEGMDETLNTELDQLFTSDNGLTQKQKPAGRLLTFTQALKKGLVSRNLINRWDLGSDPQDESGEGEVK